MTAFNLHNYCIGGLTESDSDANQFFFAMPGKEPMTVNPETGEIKVITPKIKLEKANQE